MADVSVKMGVSGLSQFKQGMTQAQASVKNVDAALKLNEKQLRANGDAEAYMQQKAQLLGQKLQAQKSQIDNAEKALKAMKASGMDPLSTSYQKMETQLLTAQAAMMDTENEIRDMGTAGANAATQTDKLTDSLQGISKKMSLDQVISGIDRITDGMENAAKKAVELGKSIWDNIVDSAGYADDIATLASRLGLTTTEVQQMQYVSGEFEASAEDIGKAWRKVKLSMASDSKDITAIYQELGIATRTGMTEMGGYIERNRDYKDVFWEIGEALMAMPIEKSAEREEYATKLLGKSWDELIPLFTAGREAYEAAMEAAPAASEKAVEQAAELNDRLNQLEQSWATLKLEVIGDLAPALTKAADALKGLIDQVTEYLQTDAGQQQLQRMSDALSGIFDSLTDFDADAIVSGVADVLEGITGAFEWISEHWEEVQTGIIMIAGAFGVLKLASLGITIANMVSGLKGIGGGQPTGAPVVAPTGGGEGQGTGGETTPVGPINADTVIFDSKLTQAGASGFVMQEASEIMARGQAIADQAEANYAEGHAWMDNLLAQYGIDTSDPEMETRLNQIRFDVISSGAQDAEYRAEMERKIAELSAEINNGEPLDIPVDPKPPEDAAEQIVEDIGPVGIPVTLIPDGDNPYMFDGFDGSHANGLPYVPFDGYMAMLHKGERVMTARENANYGRNYNSNLYVESMYMNNGMDAAGLAAAMAAAQRRTMSGYGS